MANTATLAVKIVSDSAAARRDIGASSDAVGKWGDRASKVGKFAGRALAVGIGAAAAAAVKFTQAAAEDAASAQKLSDALKQTTGATDEQVASVEKWIEAQGKALGVADDELRPALSRLATVTKDVGKAQRLASLAMDISARTGKPLKTVVEGLAKAQTGSITGLAKFGVQVKDAAGETKSLDAVMKDLSNTYSGSAAKAADTAAGRQKRLQVAMDELQEKIGAKLLPVMEKLIDVGFKVINWIDENQKVVGILVSTLGSFLAIVYVITKAIKVWTAVTAAFNAVMLINPVGLIVLAVVALVAAIVIAYKKSDTFRALVQRVGEIGKAAFDKVKAAVMVVIDAITTAVGWVKDKLTAAFEVAKRIGVAVFKAVTGAVNAVLDVIRTVWTWVKEKIPAAFSTMKDLVRRYMDIVLTPWRTLFGIIKDVWEWVKTKVPAAFETLKSKATAIGSALTAPFRSLFGFLQSIWNKIQDIIAAAKKLPGLQGDNAGHTFNEGLDSVLPPTPRLSADTTERVATVNVTVDGSIIGLSEATVGRSLLDAINRGRRDAGLAPIG